LKPSETKKTEVEMRITIKHFRRVQSLSTTDN